MKSLTDQEYLDLCQKLVDHQYDDATDDYDIDKMEWIPSEPEAKKQIPVNVNGLFDLTNVKSSEIKKQLFLCTNFKIGNFKVRVSRYSIAPSQLGAQMTFSLECWEEKNRTPNGMPCKIDFPLVMHKDNRFVGRPWLKYFNTSSGAYNVPIDTVVDIIRWMQAIKKLTAFL